MNSIDTSATGKPVGLESAEANIVAGLESDPAIVAALLQLTKKTGSGPNKGVTDPLALAALLQSENTSEEPVSLHVGTPIAPKVHPEAAPLQQDQVQFEVPPSPPKDDTTGDASHEGMGDDILQSLNAQSSQPPANTQAASEAAPVAKVDQAARIETFVSQIADRILVTDPAAGQNAQIHIKIADSVMPGTELQLWRGDAGQLNVSFHTSSAQSAQILTDASQLLAQRLNERLALTIPVVVTVQSGEKDTDTPRDGRSRQYQSVYEMLAAAQGE